MIPYADLLLLLLLASTTVATPPPPTIDWTECKDGTAHCTMTAKCLDPRSLDTTSLKFVLPDSILPDSGTCDVGTSIRPYSEDVWLLKLQLSKRNIDPAKGVQVYYGTKLIAGCQQKLGGDVAVTDGSDLSPELFGDPSRVAADDVFCSIRLKGTSILTSPSQKGESFKISSESGGAAVNFETTKQATNDFINTAGLIKCDPFSLKSDTTKLVKGLQKHEIIDPLAKTINCDAHAGSKLYVGSDEANEFKCDTVSKKYEFKKGETIKQVEPNDEVFCGIPIDELCKDLPDIPGRPKLEKGNNNKVTLKCDSKQHMLINGTFYLDGSVTCENDREDPNVATWFAPDPSGVAVQIKEAECSNGKLCSISTSSFNDTAPSDQDVIVIKRGENVTCVANHRLEVKLTDPGMSFSDTKVHPTAITCNETTGIYEMHLEDGKKPVTEHHNIYCAKTESDSLPSTGGSVGEYVGIGISVVLFLIAMAILCYVGREYLLNFCNPKRERKRAKFDHNMSSLPPLSSGPPKSTSTNSTMGSSSEKKADKKSAFKPETFGDVIHEDDAVNKWKVLSSGQKKKYIRWSIKFREAERDPNEKTNEGANATAKREVKSEAKKSEKEGGREAGGKEEVKKEGKEEMKSGQEKEKKSGKKRSKKSKKSEKKSQKKRLALKRFKMIRFMHLVEIMFDYERDPTVWIVFLPFLIFVERTFFHINQTEDHSVAERDKIIPGFCYERLRLFLLKQVDFYFDKDKIGDEQKSDDGFGEGFFRGILWLLKYKLNISNKKEKDAIVERVSEIFNNKKMNQGDDSRMVIWGILRHEDNHSFRVRGQHERFGYGGGVRKMCEYLLAEFNELLSKEGPLEPRLPGGHKMQHVLFAIGCSLERNAIMEVWKVMKKDTRFIAADFMWVMYGRDWLWDGAWSAICQAPPEHHQFCERFTQDCKEYGELTEMCIRYWADKNSNDANDGYCFEGFMRSYNDEHNDNPRLQRLYTFYDEFVADLTPLGRQMNQWLMEHDKREIDGYTPVGEELADQAKEKWEKKSDLKELAKMANKEEAGTSKPSGGRTTTGATGVTGATGDATTAAASNASGGRPSSPGEKAK